MTCASLGLVSSCTSLLHMVLFFVLPSRWYCHVDDDMYINIPTLIRKLHSYNPSEMKYVGYWLSNLWGSNRMSVGFYFNYNYIFCLVMQ